MWHNYDGVKDEKTEDTHKKVTRYFSPGPTSFLCSRCRIRDSSGGFTVSELILCYDGGSRLTETHRHCFIFQTFNLTCTKGCYHLSDILELVAIFENWWVMFHNQWVLSTNPHLSNQTSLLTKWGTWALLGHRYEQEFCTLASEYSTGSKASLTLLQIIIIRVGWGRYCYKTDYWKL